jgi:hypothetical protein
MLAIEFALDVRCTPHIPTLALKLACIKDMRDSVRQYARTLNVVRQDIQVCSLQYGLQMAFS